MVWDCISAGDVGELAKNDGIMDTYKSSYNNIWKESGSSLVFHYDNDLKHSDNPVKSYLNEKKHLN